MSLEIPGNEYRPHIAAEGAASLVSIIIPCYKRVEYLPEAIESALSQTYSHLEVIVVDDGSPDNTGEVVARYPAVRYLRQANSGVAKARNFGLESSKGEYVQFLDADDRLTTASVESHLRCFAAQPEAGFVVGDIEWVAQDNRYIGIGGWPLLKANHYEELLKVNHVANTIAVLFRRTVLQAVGGFEGFFSPAEDYEILLRAARSFPSAHHAAIVAQYRRHASNTSRHGAVMLKATHRVVVAEREFVKGSPNLEAALQCGDRHWRDFFGAVTIKELYVHLCHGRFLSAAAAVTALVRFVRGRVLLLPWKYRRRGLAGIRRLLGRSKKPGAVTQAKSSPA